MEKEIKEISDYLNTTCSNNPAEIQERISVIMVYMMRTGEMLAEAKKILRKKKSDEIHDHSDSERKLPVGQSAECLTG